MKVMSDLTQDENFGFLALFILGAGFIAMFAGFSDFFLIWILGYPVIYLLSMFYSMKRMPMAK